MDKVKVMKIENENECQWKNDKLFCIDSRKLLVKGNGIIKISPKYITINDKLVVDITEKGIDEHSVNYLDIIKNINGIHDIGNEKLNTFLDNFNDDFISLDDSINKMTPLLEMLEQGEYYISYVNIFPTTSENTFFWKFDSESKTYNSVEYFHKLPIYIRGAENHNFYNEDRKNYYLNRYEKSTKRPVSIILNPEESICENIVLDGHHKIIASYLKNEPIHAIMITKVLNNIKTPLSIFSKKNSTDLLKQKYELEDKYKEKLDKESTIENKNIFNDKLYNTKNKYPSLQTLMYIYIKDKNAFSKDEEGLTTDERCLKLLQLFFINRQDAKEYALKLAKKYDDEIDTYLAFIILNNYDEDDVIFFFSDYYSNHSTHDENPLYKITCTYLGVE